MPLPCSSHRVNAPFIFAAALATLSSLSLAQDVTFSFGANLAQPIEGDAIRWTASIGVDLQGAQGTVSRIEGRFRPGGPGLGRSNNFIPLTGGASGVVYDGRAIDFEISGIAGLASQEPVAFAEFDLMTTGTGPVSYSFAGSVFLDDNGVETEIVYEGGESDRPVMSPREQIEFIGRDLIRVDSGRIFAGVGNADDVGMNAGAIRVYDPVTGVETDTIYAPDPAPNARFGDGLVADDGLVAVFAKRAPNPGASDGAVYAYRSDTLELLARIASPDFPSPSGVTSLAVGDGMLAIGTTIGGVFLYNAETGDLTWQWSSGIVEPVTSLAIADGVVILGLPDAAPPTNPTGGAVFVLDLETGLAVAGPISGAPGSDLGRGDIAAVDGIAWIGATGGPPQSADSGSVAMLSLTDYTIQSQISDPVFLESLPNLGFGRVVDGAFGVVAVSMRYDPIHGVYYGPGSGSVFVYDADTGQLLADLYPENPQDHQYFGNATIGDGFIVVSSIRLPGQLVNHVFPFATDPVSCSVADLTEPFGIGRAHV